MILLLDTNIIIDIISRREGYENSLQILKYCETKHALGFVSTTTVTDVIYILRKHISPISVKDSIQTLLTIVDVADVLKSDLASAFSSEIKDFEDAIQVSCAKRIKASYIVTRNIKDFAKSTIPAILPTDMLKLLKSN
jgi:predicted nucleic acid-binding protein